MKKLKENENYLIGEDGVIVSVSTGKVLSVSVNVKGYKRISLYKDGKTQKNFVHRLVASNYLPDPSTELLAWASGTVYGVVLVNHIDGNKENNHCSNLEWCDNSHNVKHAYKEGLTIPASHGRALSNVDIDYINEHHKPYDKINGTIALARRFNVSKKTIQKYLKKSVESTCTD